MTGKKSKKDEIKKDPSLCSPQSTVTIIIIESEGAQQDAEVKTCRTAAEKQTTEHRFVVHKNFICHYSPFFKAAFESDFVEGKTQTMELVDVGRKEFGLFVNWLYTQTITMENGLRPDLSLLAKVWILAERFLTPVLQNEAMRRMHSRFDTSTAGIAEFVAVIARHGDGDNMLAKLAAPHICKTKISKKLEDTLPKSILLEALRLLQEGNPIVRIPTKESLYVPVRAPI